jgi:hypothetical protein
MKKRSTNPKMAMMMGRAMKRPALAVNPARPAMNPMAAMAAPTMPTMKKGGKLKPIDKSNPGLSKLPTEVRNKMGYMKKGGMAYKSGGCATKSDAKMIAKKEVKGHESSMHKMKSGGKCYASGGKASQLAKANGIAVKGKSKGRII